MITVTNDYHDIEAAEREKFLELDGVGPKTADVLVGQFTFVSRAAESLLSSSTGWYLGDLGRKRTDSIRDALQDAGFTPPCGCDHYEDVGYTQTGDEHFSWCRTCGEPIQNERPGHGRKVRV